MWRETESSITLVGVAHKGACPCLSPATIVVFWASRGGHVRPESNLSFSLQEDVAADPKRYRQNYDQEFGKFSKWLATESRQNPQFGNDLMTRLGTDFPFSPDSRSNTVLKLLRFIELIEKYNPKKVLVSGVGIEAYLPVSHVVRHNQATLRWGTSSSKFFLPETTGIRSAVRLGGRFLASLLLLGLDFLKYAPLPRAARKTNGDPPVDLVLADYKNFSEFSAERAGVSERFVSLRKTAEASGVRTRTIFVETAPSRALWDRLKKQRQETSLGVEVLLNSYWSLGMLMRSARWATISFIRLSRLWGFSATAKHENRGPGLFISLLFEDFTGSKGARAAAANFLWKKALQDLPARTGPILYISEGQYWEQAMLRASKANQNHRHVALVEFPVADTELRLSHRPQKWMKGSPDAVMFPEIFLISDWGQPSEQLALALTKASREVHTVFPNRLSPSIVTVPNSRALHHRDSAPKTILVVGEGETILNDHLLTFLTQVEDKVRKKINFVYRPHPANSDVPAEFVSFFGSSKILPPSTPIGTQLLACSGVLGLAKSFSLLETQIRGVETGAILPPNSLPRFVRLNSHGTLLKNEAELSAWLCELPFRPASPAGMTSGAEHRLPDVASEVFRVVSQLQEKPPPGQAAS